MKKILKWIKNILKVKSPCCDVYMESSFNSIDEMNIYECTKCGIERM